MCCSPGQVRSIGLALPKRRHRRGGSVCARVCAYTSACTRVRVHTWHPTHPNARQCLMQHPHAARPSHTVNAIPQGPLTGEISALPCVWFGTPWQHRLRRAGPREKPYTCHELGQDQAFLSWDPAGKHTALPAPLSLGEPKPSRPQPGLWARVEEAWPKFMVLLQLHG